MALGEVEVKVVVEVNGVEVDDVEVAVDVDSVIAQVPVSDLVDYLGAGVLLDEISQDTVVEHFGLELAE